ncbi:PA domain [Arabidopsis suecica]|uniref:PA domain n=1 Tax=Arabidopsis suecica TaxID=45249 RepID=A0A8T1XZM7_ARASU|nr:PA domain [Arabidopsis suecica]
MGKRAISSCLFSCLFALFLNSILGVTNDPQDQQVYVVYMGSLPSSEDYAPMSVHMNILQEVTGEIESSIENRLVRSYKRSFNGFAARLTESERERVAKMEGVVSVFPNMNLKLQTTTSWDFMGLKEGKRTKRSPTMESDTIIGVIDGGITPESESFSDKGFGPPPKKWKGVCAGGINFTCNNKLVGARDYTKRGTRDYDGHGTHTASTAAGNVVPDISFFGLGNGTVRGGVPASRIAAYKVCNYLCTSAAVLAAFDDAIADGVDLITISIGGDKASEYERDPIAIGAFHAMAKGILTVNSAGNNGPKAGVVSCVAPWILTVAASTTNRGFVTKVVLGDGKTLVGKSVNTFDLKGKKYPLVYGKSAGISACEEESARECKTGCLDPSLVKGKIVLCRQSEDFDINEVLSNGAVAAILVNPEKDYASVSPLPLSALSQDEFESLVSYINSTKFPQATVLRSEAIFNQTSPKVASFSSRGPNTIAVDLLKPDITAPGVEILAAYSPDSTPTESEFDTRHVKFSVMSGTSMSCPHVAAVAAYVKTFNPKWSPSMIHSAIMTTAWPMNATGTDFASTEFAYGAGHVDPIAATNPGLVYEMDKADHIAFLCGLNYTADTLKLISGDTITCTKKNLPRNLNYPSMSAQLPRSKSSVTVTFNRTVTNVGTPNSTYKSKVVLNHGSKLSVKVTPSVLSFKTVSEKKSFTVTVTGSDSFPKLPSSASLIWSDGTHNVRSPIVVYTDDAY